MRDIMYVKAMLESDEYVVKFHDRKEKRYADVSKLPKYVMKWMCKHDVSYGSSGTFWM